jgi:hypothetical protein
VKRIAFTEQARTDVRRLDIPTAMRIFAGLQRFAETGVEKLEGRADELRLRIGDYRVGFVEEGTPFTSSAYYIARGHTAESSQETNPPQFDRLCVSGSSSWDVLQRLKRGQGSARTATEECVQAARPNT